MKSRSILAVIAAGALAVGVAACGDDDTTKAGSASADNASQKPAVTFVTPTAGETSDGAVTAKVDLKQFAIDDAAVGKAAAAGKGHLHFAMDEGKYDFEKYSGANGALAKDLGVDGKYSPSVTPEITYKNLPKGEHKLEVYLANNDHTNEGAEASVTFTVQ